MELEIILEQEDSKKGIIHLKNEIDKTGIEGISAAEISRVPSKENEQGGGDLLNSIKMLIVAAQKPLVELVKCLQKYVDNYRTKITIPRKNGKDIVIEHGRSMTPEQLKEIVVSILQNNP
ncbi:MAG TPA: hypothetical protein VGM30_12495 [Puia sp.]|jgi:hypothetical protein